MNETEKYNLRIFIFFFSFFLVSQNMFMSRVINERHKSHLGPPYDWYGQLPFPAIAW